MDASELIRTSSLVLTEGSMFERMRRHPAVSFDPDVKHAALIYDDIGRGLLGEVHREYIAVANRHRLPMIVSASCWRASRERLERSPFADRPVNQDNVAFVRELVESVSTPGAPLIVAGLVGCRGDAYRPEQALGVEEAAAFHAFQVGALAEARPDILLAATLPALSEARGIARCLDDTGLPYLLSFVVRDDGTILDGTPLQEAFETIDQERKRPPLGYMVNCVHPSILEACLGHTDSRVTKRLIGLRANTAALRPDELDGAEELITAEPAELAAGMQRVRRAGLRILGGCCGTDATHIEAIASACREAS